jgi:transcriptional regulator with XRE-family HTH domain
VREGRVATRPEPNPTVARRELAVYFQRLREQRGRSLSELRELLDVDQSQASRLDSGARGLRSQDVERLCDWYGLGAGERRRLLALADEARRRAWWQQVDLAPAYRTLIGFEQVAETIREFCNTVVPGLLQTQRYAAAAAEVGGIVKPFEVERAIEVRMRRQAILGRSDPSPPELTVVIDEVVLARGVGGSEVMFEQLQHLLDLAERPRTSIQVIGFEAGMYPTAHSQFILLDLGLQIPPVFYREDHLKGVESSDRQDVSWAKRLWGVLQARALDPVRSAQRIAEYRNRLE